MINLWAIFGLYSSPLSLSRIATGTGRAHVYSCGVGPPPRPPHMDIRSPAPPRPRPPPSLFGDQSAEDKYETLLRFQAASDEFYHQKLASCKSEDEYEILQRFQAKSDEFYCRKRESIFAQLTPGNSVHRPIDLESSGRGGHRRRRHACGEDTSLRAASTSK